MDNSKLVKIERGNVVLRVPEYDVQRYLDQGFNLLDDKGNIIKQSVPNDVGTLRKAFEDHIKRIEELEKENAELKVRKQRTTKRKE